MTTPTLPKEYEYAVIHAQSTAEAQAEFMRQYPGHMPERFFYWRGVYYFPKDWKKRNEVKE